MRAKGQRGRDKSKSRRVARGLLILWDRLVYGRDIGQVGVALGLALILEICNKEQK